MKFRSKMFFLLVVAFLILPGCMTYEEYVKIDEQVKRVALLQEEAGVKLAGVKVGEVTAPEALAWVTRANEQILEANDEINKLKKGSNVGWLELLGAVAASMLGGTGMVRAWRGPTHKGIELKA